MARQITTESFRAFIRGIRFNKANMQVERSETQVVMKLHGNPIARYSPSEDGIEGLEISCGGWTSNTTKERLNALPGVSVCQRNFKWFLNGKEWDGSWVNVHKWSK